MSSTGGAPNGASSLSFSSSSAAADSASSSSSSSASAAVASSSMRASAHIRPRSPAADAALACGSEGGADSRRVRPRTNDPQPAASSSSAADTRAVQPRASVSLSSLAKVELQLCMRCCDRVSLIAFARCSRITLAAASSDFAWRLLSPMRIRSSVPELALKLSTSLLRHVDVCLLVSNDVSGSPFAAPSRLSLSINSSAEQASLTSVARLRGLDFSKRCIREEELERILSHPACAQLTELRLMQPISAALLSTLSQRQTRLQILSVRVGSSVPSALAPLVQLRYLTELRLMTAGEFPDYSALAECRNLRTLSLTDTFNRWLSVLAVPALQSLRSLELRFYARTDAPVLTAWNAAFANLSALESLVIKWCPFVDLLLPLVTQHCRALRSLTVRIFKPANPADAQAMSSSDQPSTDTLRLCLQQNPSLRLQLKLRSRRSSCGRMAYAAVAEADWDAAHAAFTQLADEFAGRVDIITFDCESS